MLAARRSYSPYSQFAVGAALLTDGGKVYTGCNVENASYGMTICAERVAVLKAVSEGHRKFKALAVVGGRGKAVPPCGACLQVLAEFCSPDFPIYLAPLNEASPERAPVGRGSVPGVVRVDRRGSAYKKIDCLSLKDLLPLAFSLNPEPRTL